MRRLFVILFGLIVILLVAGVVFFGLQTPEMPIREVHKVISIPKAQQYTTLPSVPVVPGAPPIIVPYNNANAHNASAPAPMNTPTIPQPGKVPGNALNTMPNQ